MSTKRRPIQKKYAFVAFSRTILYTNEVPEAIFRDLNSDDFCGAEPFVIGIYNTYEDSINGIAEYIKDYSINCMIIMIVNTEIGAVSNSQSLLKILVHKNEVQKWGSSWDDSVLLKSGVKYGNVNYGAEKERVHQPHILEVQEIH